MSAAAASRRYPSLRLRSTARRLRVVLHGRCFQDPSATRGVGRYAAGLLRGLRALDDPGLELWVVLDAALPLPASPGFDGATATLHGFPTLSVPLDTAQDHWLRRGAALNRALRRHRADLLHIPAQYYTDRAVRFAVPYVMTVHDLIPQHFPPGHKPPHRVARRHRRTAQACRRARVLLAPSEHTRRDCTQRLGVSPDRVVVIPPAADEHFQPVDRGDDETLRRLGVETPYFLYVGADDVHKNLDGLLAAFSAFGPGHELVLAGAVGRPAGEPGPPASVRALGYVDDADLPALYRRASALVTLSLHEGFGLPVLEAMACGTPVVAAANTALRETVGDAGLLVDAGDPRAAAAALRAVVDDATLAATLRERGLARAASHGWERFARRVLETYRRAVGGRWRRRERPGIQFERDSAGLAQ